MGNFIKKALLGSAIFTAGAAFGVVAALAYKKTMEELENTRTRSLTNSRNPQTSRRHTLIRIMKRMRKKVLSLTTKKQQ